MIPSISVIMSVFNGEKYLKEGIESILNQSFKDFEFIICDDCSTDNTYNMLKEYEKNDSRVIVVRNEMNSGLAYSLNKCISLARSNILARQDADDRSALNRFEVQYPFVIAHPEFAIVGTSYYSVSERNQVLVRPIEFPKARNLIWDGGFMHPSWMMRKDMLERVGFYTVSEKTRRDQDYHLVLKLYGAGMRICNLQVPLYYYTNDISTFNRSKNWKRVKGLMWVRWDGYRRNRFPFFVYVVCLKPLIKHLLPTWLTKRYYYRKK